MRQRMPEKRFRLWTEIDEHLRRQVKLEGDDVRRLRQPPECLLASFERRFGQLPLRDIDHTSLEVQRLLILSSHGSGKFRDPEDAAVRPPRFGLEISHEPLLPHTAKELCTPLRVNVQLGVEVAHFIHRLGGRGISVHPGKGGVYLDEPAIKCRSK